LRFLAQFDRDRELEIVNSSIGRMFRKLIALKAQITVKLKISIQASGRDLSFFDLLPTGGPCNPTFRQNYFQKKFSEPVEQLLSSLCIQDFQETFHLKCNNVISSHRCTAHTHCPLRLSVWYLLQDVNNIFENATGICLYELGLGDGSEKCFRCLPIG
jgi:hypothetical protein